MAWLDNRFRKRIRFDISNSSGLQTECPTLIAVDTQCLIDAEWMCEDGRDIRIAGADEVTLLPFTVLGGINTPNTEIGVRVDSIPNGTSSVYMYFDYVCESIQSLSDGSFWYTSVTTEQTPGLTIHENDVSVKLYIGGSGGSGSITERWSPTFNALNVSGFQFDMSCENTAHPLGSCRHYIDITGGDEFYDELWYSDCYARSPPCREDPWTDSIFGSTSNITGVHELNVEVCVYYTFSGMYSRLTTTIKITLSNDPSISISGTQEDCPTPISTETFYAKVGGNDGLDGKSYPNAWATLNHAFTNTPADQGNIIRLDEGTYNGFEGGYSPLRCINLVGGYWDGDWHDWTEGCGHNRPVVTVPGGGNIENDDVSLKYIGLDTTMGPLCFPYSDFTYRFLDCLYNGMIFTGTSCVVFTNTDRIFHQPISPVLPTSVTPDRHILVAHDPSGSAAFNTFTPREAMIRSDIDADMIIDTWSTTGDQNKAWRVTAIGSRTVEFIFADMLPDTSYDLKVDGVKVSDAISDGSGVVTFPPYTGSFSEKEFSTEIGSEAFVPRVMIF